MGHCNSHCPKRDTVNEEELEGSNLFQTTEDRYLELSDSEGSEDTHDVSFLQFFCLMSKVKGVIPWHWIILETGSSASIFKAKSILENISTTDNTLRLITNVRVISSKAKGKCVDLSA